MKRIRKTLASEGFKLALLIESYSSDQVFDRADDVMKLAKEKERTNIKI